MLFLVAGLTSPKSVRYEGSQIGAFPAQARKEYVMKSLFEVMVVVELAIIIGILWGK